MILPFFVAALTAMAPTPVSSPAPAAASLPAPRTLPEPAIVPKSEAGCGYMFTVTKPAAPFKGKGPPPPQVVGGQTQTSLEYKLLAGFKVMGGPFQLTAPPVEEKVWAYRCIRDTVVPAPFDGRVLVFLGKPLVITDGVRAGVLQINKGAFQFNMTRGEITDAERDSIQKRMDIFTANYQQSVAAAKRAAPQAPAADAPVTTKR